MFARGLPKLCVRRSQPSGSAVALFFSALEWTTPSSHTPGGTSLSHSRRACASAAPKSSASSHSTSFSANLFRAKICPNEIFPYPTRKFTDDEGENLETLVRNLQKTADKTTLKEYTDWGGAGAAIKAEYGGLQLSETAHSVALEEAAKHAPSSAYLPLILHAGLCTYLINQFGSKELKARLLGGMSDASIRMAWATREVAAGCDVSMNAAFAVNPGDGSYSITGEKLVYSAADATHFLVLARAHTQAVGLDGTPSVVKKSTLFVVERSSKGVSVTPVAGRPGWFTVTFADALAHDVVGAVGDGHVQYMVSLHSSHHLLSAVLLGLTKRTLAVALHLCEAETPSVDASYRSLVSASVTRVYGIESLLFALTANLDVPAPDNLIEATLAASLIRKQCRDVIHELYGAITSSVAVRDEGKCRAAMETVMSDAELVSSLGEPDVFLQGIGATCGIEDFGLYFQQCSTLETMQTRMWRSLGFRDRFNIASSASASSGTIDAQSVEKSVLRFGAAVEHLFVRQNVRVTHQTLALARIGESAALLHASAACVARAAMAQKKSLETSKLETKLANAFIRYACAEVEYLCEQCRISGRTADESVKRIAAETCQDTFFRYGGNAKDSRTSTSTTKLGDVLPAAAPPTPAASQGAPPASSGNERNQ